MGYDSTNFFPKQISKIKLKEFLELLDYKQNGPDSFIYFENQDYKSISGVVAYLPRGKYVVEVSLHTTIFCNNYDIEYLNKTVRLLKERFGGYFNSDLGKNRYLKYDGIQRSKAESGCFTAYEYNFKNGLASLSSYLAIRNFPEHFQQAERDENSPLNLLNPLILSNNLVLPYLVSILEEYFKSTFISLLKYSDKKQSFIKNYKIFPSDLFEINNGTMSLEEALTKSMSFQNIKKICEYFSQLDSKLDLNGLLKKPYRRKKETFYDLFNRIFEMRHGLIHHNRIEFYNTENINKDIKFIEIAIEKIVRKIFKHYNWTID